MVNFFFFWCVCVWWKLLRFTFLAISSTPYILLAIITKLHIRSCELILKMKVFTFWPIPPHFSHIHTLPTPAPCNHHSHLCFFFFFSFIFISWRLITLQYCSHFCHTLTWLSHGFTCIPPHPPIPPPYISVSMSLTFFFTDFKYKWSHTVFVFLCLA